MYFRSLLFPFLLVASSAVAQIDSTALGALRLLPKDAGKRLARIEARDGAPVPERWYLLVYDPDSERGIREFVVAGGKMVAVRTISQFADSLSATDVLGGDAVKVDSEQLARWAALFAAANGGKVGSLNYQLTKDPVSNGPIWITTVLDAAGDQLGALTVNALKGGILSSDGFEKLPAPELLAPPVAAPVSSRPSKVRVVPPPAPPKPNVVRRILGANDEKPSRPIR